MLYPAELRARGRLHNNLGGGVVAGNGIRLAPSVPRQAESAVGLGEVAYIRSMPDLVTHKADPACPMTGPHDRADCGLVAARRRRSAEMNAAMDRQQQEEKERRPGPVG
jgi:hypothetical protein